jgi:hypothetical protein
MDVDGSGKMLTCYASLATLATYELLTLEAMFD